MKSENNPLNEQQRKGKRALLRLIAIGMGSFLLIALSNGFSDIWQGDFSYDDEFILYRLLGIGIIGIFAWRMYQGDPWGQGLWGLSLFLFGVIIFVIKLVDVFDPHVWDINLLILGGIQICVAIAVMGNDNIAAYLMTKREASYEELIDQIGKDE